MMSKCKKRRLPAEAEGRDKMGYEPLMAINMHYIFHNLKAQLMQSNSQQKTTMTRIMSSSGCKRYSLLPLCMIISVNSVIAAGNEQWTSAFAIPRTKRIGRGGAIIHMASITPSNDDVTTPEHEVLLPGDIPMDIPPSSVLPLWKLAVAGGVATMLGDFTMHPMDCIKTLQQSDEGLGLSLVQASQYIWSHSGLGGFYRGLGTYLFSDGMGGALKFAVYEKLTSLVS